MSRLAKLAPALAALSFALTASAGGLEIKGKPSVKFTATGPAGLKIDGTGDDLKAKEDGGKIILKASLKNLKTGIGLRDEHTRKYIDAGKWPDASLVVEKSKLKFPDGSKVSAKAKGKFRLHGVTKDDQAFEYTAEKKDGGYSCSGKLTIALADYNIEKPCYLGVCVGETVDVQVKFQLKE